MLKKLQRNIFFLALFGCSVHPAWADDAPVYDADDYPQQVDAQTPLSNPKHRSRESDDYLFSNIANRTHNNLSSEQRLNRLEQQIDNLLRVDTTGKIEALREDTQKLRGQFDDLLHQVQQLQAQQKTLYADVDKRLNTNLAMIKSSAIATDAAQDKSKNKNGGSTLSLGKANKKIATSTSTLVNEQRENSQPDSAEEQQIYQTAYHLIKLKKYNEAALQFEKMLHQYPTGQFAANAHYWLGDLYNLMGKKDQAITEFNAVLKYRDSSKLADAQLKLGLLYAGLLKWSAAKDAFRKVINTYPGTSSAHLASEQLKQIQQEVH